MARPRQGPGPAAYGFRPAASSSHSLACERARRAASRAGSAVRRSSAASSLRRACSCLSACASASAALTSSASAVWLSTDDSRAALTRVRPSTSFSSASWRFDASRVHSVSNDGTPGPSALLRRYRGHLALQAGVPRLRAGSATLSGCAAAFESQPKSALMQQPPRQGEAAGF